MGCGVGRVSSSVGFRGDLTVTVTDGCCCCCCCAEEEEEVSVAEEDVAFVLVDDPGLLIGLDVGRRGRVYCEPVCC